MSILKTSLLWGWGFLGNKKEKDFFEQEAAAYEQAVLKTGRQEIAEKVRMIVRANFPAAAEPKILDLGCGTGIPTKELSTIGPTRGLDISEAMIHYARTTKGESDRLQWQIGDMNDLSEEPDASVDALVNVRALKFIDDVQAFYRDAFRMLTEGGIGVFPWGYLEKANLEQHRNAAEKADLRTQLVRPRYTGMIHKILSPHVLVFQKE